MKLETRIAKIISGYNNKPDVFVDDQNRIIHLVGGHFQARNDVEEWLGSKSQLISVSNSPESKKIHYKD